MRKTLKILLGILQGRDEPAQTDAAVATEPNPAGAAGVDDEPISLTGTQA